MSDADSSVEVEYREIPGYPGYRVGDDGSVWSRWGKGAKKMRTEWKQLKHSVARGLRPTGTPRIPYHGIRLRGNPFLVHQVVLSAFRGPCPSGMECRHDNGDPQDNRLSNLLYGTPKQNAADRVRHGTAPRGENCGRAVLTALQVEEVFGMLNSDMTHAQIAKHFGVVKTTISGISRRQSWRFQATEFVSKGRRFGSRSVTAKLDEASVAAIKVRLRGGAKASAIAKEYGVNCGTITCIKQGRTWRHVA